jgi:hypothetical protein
MVMHRHALAALIDQVKREQEWSDEDIAMRARRRGHQISKQHISAIRATDPLKSLVPSTLRALADGLGVPLGQVVEAALPSAGLPPIALPVDWTVEAAIAADVGLPDAAKRMLLTMLESARSEPARRDGHRAPVTRLSSRDATGKAARKTSDR